VLSFLRGIHVVECSGPALAEAAPHIDALGGAEDLPAHAAAVRARIPRGEHDHEQPGNRPRSGVGGAGRAPGGEA